MLSQTQGQRTGVQRKVKMVNTSQSHQTGWAHPKMPSMGVWLILGNDKENLNVAEDENLAHDCGGVKPQNDSRFSANSLKVPNSCWEDSELSEGRGSEDGMEAESLPVLLHKASPFPWWREDVIPLCYFLMVIFLPFVSVIFSSESFWPLLTFLMQVTIWSVDM